MHAVGSAVSNVSEGDKVIVHPLITCGLCRACRSGDDVHCEANAFPGIDTNGGYADYLKTSARSVVKIDDALEPSDVAALADAALTAYHAAAKAARRLTPRDKCVIIGAGGLGHIGIQVLKALSPAELIVVDRNPDALKLAEAIGADHGVVADGTQVDQVLALTGGNGAETVVDFVGEGGATAEGVAMLRRAGDYHVVGYGENIDVPTIDIISTEINFIGNLVGSYNDLCDLMALAARGAVNLHTQKYAAGRLPVRHRRSRQRQRPRPSDPHAVKESHMIFIVSSSSRRRSTSRTSPTRSPSSPRPPATSRATCSSTGRAAWRIRRNTFWWKGSATATPARSTSPASTSRSSSPKPRRCCRRRRLIISHEIDATGGARWAR